MDSIKCQALLLAIQYGSLTAAGKELGYTQGNRLPSARAQQAGRPAVGQWPADGAGLSGSRQGFAKGRRLGGGHSRRPGRGPQYRQLL